MPKSILVADDDREMRKLYARIFTDSGYSITMASTFSEASGFITANHYDLLVTDLMLPDGLGTELIKIFEKKRAGASSLLVTGSASADGILERAGIDDYFQKPFKVEDFLAAVGKRLTD